jgi:hypothetical protein
VSIMPTPDEERWLALASRLHLNAEEGPFAEHVGEWRSTRLLSRIAFFVLGIIAAAMIVFIVGWLPGRDAKLVLGALTCIAVAEWLIVARHYFWSGIEEALELIGLIVLTYDFASHLGAHTQFAGEFLAGMVLTIAGLRLLNPLFTTLAALAFVAALTGYSLSAGLLCYGAGVAALVAGGHRFSRPSHDLMLDSLVVVMPLAGYLWSSYSQLVYSGVDYRHAAAVAWLTPIVPLLFAAIAFAVGLARRTHAPIIAAMTCVACAGYELRRFSGLSLEARLITWGCVLLAIAVSVERFLRTSRAGITSRQLSEAEGLPGIMNIAGSAVITPVAASTPAAPSYQGGGGGAAGAGASGRY